MLSSQEQVGEVEARFSRGIPTIPNGWPAVSVRPTSYNQTKARYRKERMARREARLSEAPLPISPRSVWPVTA